MNGALDSIPKWIYDAIYVNEVQTLVEANSKPHDIVIYMDGSVTRDRSCWGFTAKQDVRTVDEDSGAHTVTTSGLTWR